MPTEKCPRLPAHEYVHMKRKSDGHRQGWRRSLTTCALASFSELPVRKGTNGQGTPPDHMSRRAMEATITFAQKGSCAIHTRYCLGRSHTLHHHKSMQRRQIFFFLQTRKLKPRTVRDITRTAQPVSADQEADSLSDFKAPVSGVQWAISSLKLGPCCSWISNLKFLNLWGSVIVRLELYSTEDFWMRKGQHMFLSNSRPWD